jgi:hypothetical protein
MSGSVFFLFRIGTDGLPSLNLHRECSPHLTMLSDKQISVCCRGRIPRGSLYHIRASFTSVIEAEIAELVSPMMYGC